MHSRQLAVYGGQLFYIIHIINKIDTKWLKKKIKKREKRIFFKRWLMDEAISIYYIKKSVIVYLHYIFRISTSGHPCFISEHKEIFLNIISSNFDNIYNDWDL